MIEEERATRSLQHIIALLQECTDEAIRYRLWCTASGLFPVTRGSTSQLVYCNSARL